MEGPRFVPWMLLAKSGRSPLPAMDGHSTRKAHSMLHNSLYGPLHVLDNVMVHLSKRPASRVPSSVLRSSDWTSDHGHGYPEYHSYQHVAIKFTTSHAFPRRIQSAEKNTAICWHLMSVTTDNAGAS